MCAMYMYTIVLSTIYSYYLNAGRSAGNQHRKSRKPVKHRSYIYRKRRRKRMNLNMGRYILKVLYTI